MFYFSNGSLLLYMYQQVQHIFDTAYKVNIYWEGRSDHGGRPWPDYKFSFFFFIDWGGCF